MDNVIGMNGETKVNEVKCNGLEMGLGLNKGKTLYEEFMGDIKKSIEVVTSCLWDSKNDRMLKAITKGSNDIVWVYNYSRIDGEKDIVITSCIFDMDMAKSLFNVA